MAAGQTLSVVGSQETLDLSQTLCRGWDTLRMVLVRTSFDEEVVLEVVEQRTPAMDRAALLWLRSKTCCR